MVLEEGFDPFEGGLVLEPHFWVQLLGDIPGPELVLGDCLVGKEIEVFIFVEFFLNE